MAQPLTFGTSSGGGLSCGPAGALTGPFPNSDLVVRAFIGAVPGPTVTQPSDNVVAACLVEAQECSVDILNCSSQTATCASATAASGSQGALTQACAAQSSTCLAAGTACGAALQACQATASTSRTTSSGTLAFTSICQRDQYGRPVAAQITYVASAVSGAATAAAAALANRSLAGGLDMVLVLLAEPSARFLLSITLHELGHAVYSSKNIPQSVPYVLRDAAHILTTEGVAMQFEQFSKDVDWLAAMGVPVADPKAYDEAGAKAKRGHLLIFSRWCQVMLRFEKAMYANPDQDLNKLWWDLVEKYQGLKRPEGRNMPDYGSKIHIVSSPAYYHNYMMGQLFASQVHHAICRDVLGGVAPAKASYVGNKGVGKFMVEKVFAPGRSLSWKDLAKFATGEPLSAKAFAADFRG